MLHRPTTQRYICMLQRRSFNYTLQVRVNYVHGEPERMADQAVVA